MLGTAIESRAAVARVRVTGVAAAMLSLGFVSCDRPGDDYARKYDMLVASDAAAGLKCEYARLAANAYFEDGSKEEFLRWERRRKTACHAVAGTLTGLVSFPSDYIPNDLEVCAQEIQTRRVSCTSARGKAQYALKLPVGTYVIWAQTDNLPDVRAFYSRAVSCGLSIECNDHSPIKVAVSEGKTQAGIDPGDWYAGTDAKRID